MNTIITPSHKSKPAYIYIRQSTPAQVLHNQESSERQYALQDQALALGWPQRSIRVLDRDLGRSGTQMSGRADFKTLVADVSMGQVGAVFALEVSRLARSNLDWHRLLELCALTHTLVIDADGCYDPGDFNDGLLLGLKGTMAQAELHFLRGRLLGGKLNKAHKGELRLPVPVGYFHDDQGCTVIDPDEQVSGAVHLVFRLFLETGSAYAVVQRFAHDGLRFPKRAYGGAWAGKLTWGRLSHGRVLAVIRNPAYAGTYVFGRRQCCKSITAEGEVRKNVRVMPTPDWRVHLPDHHEGYITVEEFEQNQKHLARNRTNGEGTVLNGAAREGLAILQGLLLCGHCGHALTVRYQGHRGIRPTYVCNWKHREGLSTTNCLSMRTEPLDNAICQEVFNVLKPVELELALAALNDLEQRDQAIMRQWQMRIERAEYECALAERRYQEVDPSNRLVAASLEHRWNEALLRVEEAKSDAEKVQKLKARVVTPEQKAKVVALARDLPRLWNAKTTQAKDRKRMLRLLIRDITVEKPADTKQVVLHIRWLGGACTDTTAAPPARGIATQTVERIRELARDRNDAQLVEALNEQGLRSSRGRPFTLSMVKWIRYRHGVPAPSQSKRVEELSVRQLAQQLGVAIHFVHYWIKQGVIPARQFDRRGPWWITLTDQLHTELRDRIANSVSLKNLHPKTQL